MFAVTVRFRVSDADAARFTEMVAAQARNSLEREPACRRFDVWTDAAEPGVFFLYELYDDRAAFDAHLETAHYLAFNTACQGLVEEKVVALYGDGLQVGAAEF